MPLTNAIDNLLVDGLQAQFAGSATGDIWFRNSSGEVFRLGIGGEGQVLTVSSTLLPTWQTYLLPDASVTFAQIQPVSSGRLLGRNAAGSGPLQELDASAVRALAGLGTAATANTGTGAGNVPILDAGGKLNSATLPSLALTSIQVVANQAARLALANVEIGDSAKQTDNGITYMLSALPASTDANWVSVGDTTIVAGDIVSGTIATARLGGGTANSSSFLRGDQQWIVLGGLATFSWQTTATNTTMAVNQGYFANGGTPGTPVVLTLPASASVGAVIEVVGTGTAGWRIVQSSASHQIHFGRVSSTLGSAGYLASTHFRNTVRLVAISATVWQMTSSQGALDCA